MKKVFAMSSVLIGLVFLAGCGQQPASQTQPAPTAPVSKQPTAPVVQEPVTSQPTTVQQPAPVIPSNQKYLEIKELGFKIPIDASMVGELTYKIVKSEGTPYSSAQFSSKTGKCDAGLINKISGTPAQNVTGESEFYANRTSDIRQFDGYFLFHSTPQAVSCNAKYLDTQTKVLRAVSEGFKNAVSIAQ